ncbi:DUF2793 domain-containing protein [Siccirubricoccus deserti]|uniref:DUF2793 domain-containing protein n=1 Tax=Siccirubricoccus deserti TaxID=2013562 RepID=A0A9X0UEW9_9PROT|nr:DUF2793 domain-containing protein [Siccirubricoccus deserti]MBC4018117.1 DUF2793 domain-containing protein [Siccirubricoccus deserti]
MSGTTTPRLALPYIAVGQAQKELAHSQGLNRLDALVQATVQQVGLNTPPGSPVEGQAWILGTAPTGAWAGWANRLVQRIGGAWQSYAAFTGLVVYDAATLTQWGWTGAAWVLVAPRIIDASAIYDPPSIAAGGGVTTTIAVTGAALGDIVRVSFGLDLQGLTLTAWVSASGTVAARFQNGTAAAIDPGSATLRVRVEKP